MERFFKAVKKIAQENPEGFTVDLTTLKKVTAGISVAYLETQNSFGDGGPEKVETGHAPSLLVKTKRNWAGGLTAATTGFTTIRLRFSPTLKRQNASAEKTNKSQCST